MPLGDLIDEFETVMKHKGRAPEHFVLTATRLRLLFKGRNDWTSERRVEAATMERSILRGCDGDGSRLHR